ncbi:SDR family oxidoreductase [Chryseolinea sp. T2]|uniref:SDR family oxidoreductase n=1 Tax=Chryseolinea sp. T2 TaxID=3129255 RepID=UPI003077E723
MRKLIIVTGGSKGIGRAIVEKFMAQGFDAVTCSRNPDHLLAVQKAVKQRYPESTLHVFKADLAKFGDVKNFCEFVAGLSRQIDVLVNNAGYFVPGKIVSEPDDTLSQMIDANLYSAYHTTRGLMSLVRPSSGSYIFNMCSIASFMAYPNGGSYAISKFALLGFSKCLRAELKNDGIRVSAIMPGATLTDSWSGTELPDDRFVKPEDVADTVFNAFSLSPRAVVEEIIIRPQLGDI